MDFQIEPIQNPNLGPPALPRQFLTRKRIKQVAWGAGGLLVVALVAFLLGRSSFSEGKVDLKIEGPTEITAGELVTYKITYKNNNRAALSDVKLNFFYPQDAIVSRDGNIVSGAVADNITIGELKRGESGEKDLAAYVVGDSGNIKTAKATLTFKPRGVNSEFKKDQTLATTITSLAIPITLVATPTVVSGQGTSYLIDYRNQSDQDYNDLRFVIKYPDGFNPISYSPKPTSHTSNQDSWDIAKLAKDSGSRITIQGTLTGSENETKNVSVTLQRKLTTPGGDMYADFEKVDASSVVASPLLSLNFTLNDSNDYTAHLGDSLLYKINFKNNTNSAISGLGLTVRLTGNMYDYSTVNSNGFFDGRLNTITWNGSNIPELNLLDANGSGVAEFEVRLKDSFSGGGAKDSFVKVSAHLETSNVPSQLDLERLTADNELVTRISGSPTFSQKLLINDVIFGANGPFPPRVNKKTGFTARWDLVNPSNNITSAQVTAVLGPGVVWENQVRVNGSQVQPTYNSRTSSVTWDLGTLPAGTGVSFPPYETNFLISITPSINQVNQPVTLLKSIHFDGTDSFTGEKISRTIRDTTTVDISDSNQSGVVQP